MNKRAFILSALIAGGVMGLLGNLPILNFVNCILCLWVWLGGFLAIYLYRRYQPGGPPLSLVQAAGLGATAGLVGAFVGAVIFLDTGAISQPMMNQLWQTLQIEGDNPFQDGGFAMIALQALIFLIINLVLYPLFGALSSMISANLLWRKPAAPAA